MDTPEAAAFVVAAVNRIGAPVSEAPPEPLYVNAPEITETEVGDVVRDADNEASENFWAKSDDES